MAKRKVNVKGTEIVVFSNEKEVSEHERKNTFNERMAEII
jgi:hypothetical protein